MKCVVLLSTPPFTFNPKSPDPFSFLLFCFVLFVFLIIFFFCYVLFENHCKVWSQWTEQCETSFLSSAWWYKHPPLLHEIGEININRWHKNQSVRYPASWGNEDSVKQNVKFNRYAHHIHLVFRQKVSLMQKPIVVCISHFGPISVQISYLHVTRAT